MAWVLVLPTRGLPLPMVSLLALDRGGAGLPCSCTRYIVLAPGGPVAQFHHTAAPMEQVGQALPLLSHTWFSWRRMVRARVPEAHTGSRWTALGPLPSVGPSPTVCHWTGDSESPLPCRDIDLSLCDPCNLAPSVPPQQLPLTGAGSICGQGSWGPGLWRHAGRGRVASLHLHR